MTALKDIVFESSNYWVKRVPKGFEVYKTGLTHSTRVAVIGYTGDKGLQRAKAEVARREASGGPSVHHSTKKRTAQLDQEIRDALARIPRNPNLKTRAQLDAEIDAILAGGLPAERYEVAQALGFRYPKKAPPKKMTITGTNIFSLAELVLDAGGRSTFPNRMGAPSKPHIRRTIEAGLVELSSPTTLTLTSEGQAAVLHDLRSRYEQSLRSFERSPERYDARARDRLEQMRRAIENLEAA